MVTHQQTKPSVYVFRVPESGIAFRLQSITSEGYVIGRSDVQSAFPPDIDLTPYNGRDRGVSRRHAALALYGNELHIVDLDSVNGTFVNAKRLMADSPYALRSGDRIVLGDFELIYEHQPA